MNDVERRLDEIYNHCRTLPLPSEHIRSALERIDQFNLQIDQLQTQLSPPPPPASSLTQTNISSPTATNGFHHSSKRQVNNALCKLIICVN